MAKIGRNQPCPCGSGKKYKKCHGALVEPIPARLQTTIEAFRRAQEGRQMLRNRAEGHGRPIISEELADYRVVAVGSRIYHGKDWPFFTDFLLHHMKEVLGRRWGQQAIASRSNHPILSWLKRLSELSTSQTRRNGYIISSFEGAVAAAFRFAYALYLIAHHDVIHASLIRRLRQAREFKAAAIETFVTAAFVLAGYKVKMCEDRKGQGPEGEFVATSANTGKTFSVEAKRKSGWKTTFNLESDEFKQELELWVQRKVYAAAKKRLENPLYWLELSLKDRLEQSEAERLQQLVRSALRKAEATIRVNGAQPEPAYVFVSNHPFIEDENSTGAHFLMLEGFHIHLPVRGENIEIEKALEQRDRDRDAIWILESMQRVQAVPHRFDGLPDELLDDNWKEVERFKIGQRVEIILDDGSSERGLIVDVATVGSEATLILFDEDCCESKLVNVPLSDAEQRLVSELGDLAFGKPDGSKRIEDDDPLAIYDFFLKTYRNSTREKLLEFIEPHPQSEQFRNLSTEDLCVRLCREWTKSVLADHQNRTVPKREQPSKLK